MPPRATLHFVLRDGFDAVEEDVRETLQGEAEGDAGQVIPHEQVTAEISAMIGRSAARRGKKPLEWVVSARAALTLTMDKIHREDALTAVLVAQRIEISLATVQSFPFISTPVKGTRSRS